MKRVSILLLSIVAVFASGVLKTDEIMELFLFLILLILLFVLTISLTRYVQRYLIVKRIEDDCKDVFTDEFYNRLKKTVLKNELKQVSDDKLCSRQAKNK